MGEYTREETGGRFQMGSHGREMQMLSIKDSFDKQPDAREFILSLYQMTIEEDEAEPKGAVLSYNPSMDELRNMRNYVTAELARRCTENYEAQAGATWEAGSQPKMPGDVEQAKAILGGAGHFNWDSPPGDIMEDMRKAKAAIKADTGLYPTRWIMSGKQERRWLAAAGMLPPAATRDEIMGPLTVISESVSWTADSTSLNPTSKPRVTCHCRNPIGMWFRVDDRVRVETSPNLTQWGIVTKVRADGNVDVLLDAEPPPGVKPYDPALPLPIDVPAVFDRDGQKVITDEAVLNAIRNKKADLNNFLERNRKGVSPNDDILPHVRERGHCDECKGTGTWTNPANAEESPCSRGCKP